MKFLIRILFRLKLLPYVNLVFRDKNGHHIPVIKGLGYWNLFENESWLGHLIGKLIGLFTTGLFLDIGANIGQTLLKVKAASEEFAYVGFEPNPACLYYLSELIAANKFANATIYPVGLSTISGVSHLYMYSDDTTDSTASTTLNFRSGVRKTMLVPMLDGNTLHLEKQLRIIKIDVEGGELEVLQGLWSLIKNSRPYIICEVLPVYDQNNTSRLDRQLMIEQMLREIDYRIFRLSENGKITPLTEFGIHSRVDHSNYLFIPSENEATITQLLPT